MSRAVRSARVCARGLAVILASGLALAACGGESLGPDAGPADQMGDRGPDTTPDRREPDAADGTDGGDVVTDTRDGADAVDGDGGPGPVSAGRACSEDADCGAGSFCLTEPATGFPGGFCTAMCDPAGPDTCGEGSACLGGGSNVCLPVCQGQDDCRPGYLCTAGSPPLPDGQLTCVPGNAEASIGSACGGRGDCLPGDFCVAEGPGLVPGGYCSRVCNPDQAGSCGAGAECVPDANPQNPQGGICAATCAGQTDCRTGYACTGFFSSQPTTTTVCAPGSATAAIGDACTGNLDCPAGIGFCIDQGIGGQPDGYCSQPCDPAAAGSCGAGAECVVDPNPQNRAGGICVASCAADSECRTGYLCVSGFVGLETSGTVCSPGNDSAVTGDPCITHGDCAAGEGVCIVNAGVPGGYCSQRCDPAGGGGCSGNAECVDFAPGTVTEGLCVARCGQDTDCRAGYQCTSGFQGRTTTDTVCAPGNDGPVALGAPCADGSACQAGSQFCLGDDVLSGGYCSSNCDPRVADSCGSDYCLPNDDGNPAAGLCLARCTSDADCATLRGAGGVTYGCSDRLGGGPLPAGTRVCLPFSGEAAVGDTCEGLGDCQLGGFCIGPPGNPGFGDGYCSAGCDPAGASTCGDGTACVAFNPQAPAQGTCLVSCARDGDCREGYFCRLGPGNTHVCFP